VGMVEIPKQGGKGVRVLGVASVADRIVQTVAAMALAGALLGLRLGI
jgi:RNA-directed DNA polymerase